MTKSQHSPPKIVKIIIKYSIYYDFTDWCYLLKTKLKKSVANQSWCKTVAGQYNITRNLGSCVKLKA